MLSEERKKELNALIERASCAGDEYYFDMEQDEFDEEMEGCEDEEFYKGFCRQREIGFEAYQKEIYIIYVISILVLRGDIMDKKRNIALCAEA